MYGNIYHGNVMRRRNYIAASGVALATGFAGCTGDSNGEYPSGDIEVVIPFSAGGGTDTMLRNIIPALEDELDTNMPIKNVPGAGSLLGTGEVFTADPDGYTMLAINPPSTPVSAISADYEFDLRDMTGIASYAFDPYCLAADPSYEFDGLDAVVDAYADGEISAIGGQEEGGPLHILALLVQDWLEWENYVPYDGGGETTQAIMSDEVPLGFTTPPDLVELVPEGNLDFIATMASEPVPAFEDYPTITDEGYDNIDFIAQLTRNLWFPPDTDDEYVETVSEGVEAALQSDEVQEWADDAGVVLNYQGPEATQESMNDVYETVQEEIDFDQF